MLLATADYYRLTQKAVSSIDDQVRAAVSGWEQQARDLGARSDEVALMHGVIDADR